MKPTLCGQKVEELSDRLSQLDSERQTLEHRRGQLEQPAIDHRTIGGLIDNLENVMAAGTKAQQKHLVSLLVKKVLVHHREKVEVWYQVPNPQRFEHCDNWLPGLDSNQQPCG